VRKGMQLTSNCTKIHISLYENEEHCLNAACNASSNVVIYEHYIHKLYACSMCICQSKDGYTDWDYRWQRDHEHTETKAYALPHPSTKRCRHSYYIKTSSEISVKQRANCTQRTYVAVVDVNACISRACDEEADVFDYLIDSRTCKIIHCTWDYETWEYNFYFSSTLKVSDKVATYTLSSHRSSPKSNITLKNITAEPTIQMTDMTKSKAS
ncbi:unnamed protein product, partial [Owenia fusiformis]